MANFEIDRTPKGDDYYKEQKKNLEHARETAPGNADFIDDQMKKLEEDREKGNLPPEEVDPYGDSKW